MILRPTVRSPRRAFTLMEILLALAVSGIVLSVITTVYFSALQLRNRTVGSFDEILPLQHAVAVIKRDLAGILPPGGTLSGELQSTPGLDDVSASMNLFAGGQQVSPLFYTASGIIDEYSPFADVQQVAYYLVPATNAYVGGQDLVRVVSGNLLPSTTVEATSRWLMGGIESMYFHYHDGTSWLTSWDSTVSSNLPTAIKVELVLTPDDNRPNAYLQEPVEIIVPLVMQARTVASNDEEETE
jgi:prepilin-type N-terminal cleavage/methylation domain-containing protein